MTWEEYFERDVKQHELLSDNDIEGMEEYFEADVKSEVESV